MTRMRNRGTKAPLSKEAVVQAGLDCLQNKGLTGLTMRNVAALLETGPASLYVYVQSQRELQVAVLDAVIEQVDLDVTQQTPDEPPVVALMLGYAKELFRYPGAARLALLTTPTGPAFLTFLECALRHLSDQGLSLELAEWTLDALVLLTTSSVAEQDQRRDENGPSIPELYDEALTSEALDLPLLRSARALTGTSGGGERLRWSLRTFMAGTHCYPDEGRPS